MLKGNKIKRGRHYIKKLERDWSPHEREIVDKINEIIEVVNRVNNQLAKETQIRESLQREI